MSNFVKVKTDADQELYLNLDRVDLIQIESRDRWSVRIAGERTLHFISDGPSIQALKSKLEAA